MTKIATRRFRPQLFVVTVAFIVSNFSLANSDLNSRAPNTEVEYIEVDTPSWWANNWYWVLGATGAVLGLAQVKESPVIFSALEAGGAIYMMNEWYKDHNASTSQLVTPLGLTTLALINLTLLREDDTTRGDVFRYNAAGLALVGLSYYWGAGGPRRRRYFVTLSSDSNWMFHQVWSF